MIGVASSPNKHNELKRQTGDYTQTVNRPYAFIIEINNDNHSIGVFMKLSIKIILSAIALLLLITMINYKQKDPYFFLQPQLPFTQEDKAFDLSKEGSESEFEFWILPNKKEDVLPLWHMVGVSCVYPDGKNLIRTESVRLEVGVAFYQNGKWIDVSVFGKKKPPSDEIEIINYQVPIDNKMVFMSGISGGNQVL